MASVMCSNFSIKEVDMIEHTTVVSSVVYSHQISMQEEDIIEHTNAKCHLFTRMFNMSIIL